MEPLSIPAQTGGYVIAIDVGIMNLGLCVFDFVTNQIVHWDRVTICQGTRYQPMKNVEYIHNFLRKYEAYFQQCFVLLIERQIRCNMRIVESVMHALFYDRAIVIPARSIKVHFNISTKNYRGNKAKAIEWATAFLAANPHVFQPHALTAWSDASKRDDLADSLLILMYYLDTYSNQLTNQLTQFRVENVSV